MVPRFSFAALARIALQAIMMWPKALFRVGSLGLLAVGLMFLSGFVKAESAYTSEDNLLPWAEQFAREVDHRLNVPLADQQRYILLLQQALVDAHLTDPAAQAFVLVDRSAQIQASMVIIRTSAVGWYWVGATAVSTGKTGTFDFGWQVAERGWGEGGTSKMRLQMHATDPRVLEHRLGRVASEGCIRIPATLNVFLDGHGVLDADYEQALAEGQVLWLLKPGRQIFPWPGRYLVIIDTQAVDRPPWSPLPGSKPPPALPQDKRLP